MNQRILAVDVLRGITLLGVVIVNAITINGPYFLDTIDFPFKLHWFDQISSAIISTIFLEKFYPIFVFLFGLSNQIFLSRLIKKYDDYYQNKQKAKNKVLIIFCKRMLILALIGCLHLSLFFWGDVLLVYAILGIILVIIINNICNYNYKKMAVIILWLIALAISLGFTNKILIGHSINYEDYHNYYTDIVKEQDDNIEYYKKIYSDGNILNNITNNIRSYYKLFIYGMFKDFNIIIFIDNFNYFLELFILMLLGALVTLIPDWYNKIINIECKTFYKILTVNFLIFLISESNLQTEYEIIEVIEYIDIIITLNNVMLYLNLFLLIFKHASTKNIFQKPLIKIASIGKMTLTWYLLLSSTMSFILYDYGLSLYSYICVTNCIIIGLIFYMLAYQVSHLWIAKYNQGPVEKLWRLLSIPNDKSTVFLSKKDQIT